MMATGDFSFPMDELIKHFKSYSMTSMFILISKSVVKDINLLTGNGIYCICSLTRRA